MTTQQHPIEREWTRPSIGPLGKPQPSPIGDLLFAAYRVRALRPVVRALLDRLEGGIMCSHTWRRIYRSYEGVIIGAFSRGAGIRPGLFPRGTVIGRYSALAAGLRVLRRNHTASRISQHPLFFNHTLGIVACDTIPETAENPLKIGSDVWIGMDVIICPGCRAIGDGAIVGAGAVLTRDVPPFTVVAGNPARPIRPRFPSDVEAVIAASEWWLRPFGELAEHLDLFTQDITGESLQRFAEAFPARPDETAPTLSHTAHEGR